MFVWSTGGGAEPSGPAEPARWSGDLWKGCWVTCQRLNSLWLSVGRMLDRCVFLPAGWVWSRFSLKPTLWSNSWKTLRRKFCLRRRMWRSSSCPPYRYCRAVRPLLEDFFFFPRFLLLYWNQRLCLKSLTTPFIVHYIVTTPFCSAVRMSSGEYYTLYSALKVSHNASRKVVYNRWSLTKQYLPSCIAPRTN